MIFIACFHPLIGHPPTRFERLQRLNGRLPGKGNQYVILGSYDKISTPSYFSDYRNEYEVDITGEAVRNEAIPCGQCVGCRLDYSRQWANRCVLESLQYEKGTCWFATLTYSDESLSNSRYTASSGLKTLVYKDLQDFNKRLRTNLKRRYGVENLRFYASGEYGDLSGRPHFHVLYFGLPLFDAREYKANRLGDMFYISDEFERTWGHGFAPLSAFNWKNAAYTARYIMKKAKGDQAESFLAAGLAPQQSRMSLKPGIGLDYFSGHYEDIYERDEIVLPSNGKKANVIKPPRYFDKQFALLDSERMAKIKDNRRAIADLRHEVLMSDIKVLEVEYLDFQEKATEGRIKKLARHKSFDDDPLQAALRLTL